MADVKNFGLIGVGSNLQFGKAGTKLINNAGTFNFKAANGSTDAALTAAGITSSAGNITLTTGNLVASAGDLDVTLGDLNLAATGASIVIGTDTTLSRQAAGVLKAEGTAAFMVPVGDDGQQPTGVTGMIRINSQGTPVFEYYNGTVWTQVSGTSALQTEIDNIETSLGAGINSNGTFNAAGFPTTAALSSPTSFTDAINQLSTFAAAHDTLDEIFPQTGAGNVIYSDGSNWLQAAPGSTSGVQAWDADLDALAALTTTGISVRTGSGTWATRTLVQPAAGLTISNADGVAGNPTFALANDLAALEGLTTTGYIVRTGDGTATTRTITGTTDNIVVTNGSGVSSDTSIDLATVTQANTGDFVKVTLDGFGRVTGNTAVVAGDITALVDGTYVNTAGDSMTGNLTMTSGATVTGLPSPTAASDAANKAYVDATAAGLTWKTAVIAATTANVDISTDLENGDTLDGVTLATGNRVLVKNQTSGAENGIYVVQASGAAVRSADADSPSELDGAAVFVQQGSTNADTGWVQTATIVTVGTTPQTWVQFSGSSTYVAGVGLLLTGNTFSVNLGAGITQLPSDEVGIDVESGKAVQLTGNASGDQLTFVLDGGAASGLEQSAAGLKISAAGVTNAMLANPGVTLNADSGTPKVLDLGETFQVIGTSVQGISTALTEPTAGTNTITITAADATSSQKGVASFTSPTFTVTAGNVDISTSGVTNAMLANSTITFTGTSGSDAVALGESMAIISADSAITTTMGTNSLSIQLNTVDVSHGGTGLTSVTAGEILYGAGTSPLDHSAAFTFDDTDTLTVGTGTFQGSATDLVITATATNADLVLMPNGTGSVIVGPSGAGLIQSDVGTALTVRGNTVLTLESGSGSTLMKLTTGTSNKVSVSGPTATDYATSLAANDLTNKQYVDDAIASGAAAGAIKAYSATVSLAANGSTNIGSALPAGATIVSVKVVVGVVDSAATLVVGKAGGNQYMTATENDPQTAGMYIAETYVVEAGSVTVQATVAGTAGDSGATCTVMVEYKVA